MLIYDNKVDEHSASNILQYANSIEGWIEEQDNPGQPSSGYSYTLEDISLAHFLLERTGEDYTGLVIDRVYFNKIQPQDCEPFYHIDGLEGLTLLYYVNGTSDPDDLGATYFQTDSAIEGVNPLPRRIVTFLPHLVHRASPYRSGVRFTLAVKLVRGIKCTFEK